MEPYVALITLFTFIIVILLLFILIQFSVLRHTINDIKDIFRSLRSKIDDLFVYVKHINENININNTIILLMLMRRGRKNEICVVDGDLKKKMRGN